MNIENQEQPSVQELKPESDEQAEEMPEIPIQNEQSQQAAEQIQPELPQENCPICYNPYELKTIHGTCKFCESCIMNSILVSFQNVGMAAINFGRFNCPSGCGASNNISIIYNTFSNESVALLGEYQTLAYAKRESDVVLCPNSGCKYAGFYTAEHADCKKPFQCEDCQTFFQHPIIGTVAEGGCKDLLSRIVKAFTTKKCPQCGIQITKNGGCNHMVCGRCQLNFNWSSVSYPGWRILSWILVITSLVLGWYYYQEIKTLLIIIKPFVTMLCLFVFKLLLFLLKLMLVMLLVAFHFIICLIIINYRGNGCFACCMFLLPFALDYAVYWLFPNVIKTVFTDLFMFVFVVFLLSVVISSSVFLIYGIVVLCQFCWQQIRRRRRRRSIIVLDTLSLIEVQQPNHVQVNVGLIEDFNLNHSV